MTIEPSHWRCLYPQANTAATVAITPDNRGMAYGDGFFTTMGVIDGAILWQDYHYQRLISHAYALQLDIDSQALLATLQAYAQQLQQGLMKLVVTRAAQDIRGYGFIPDASGSACEIWLKSSAMPITSAESVRLPDGRTVLMQPATTAVCLNAQLACLPPILAGLKSLNRLDNVLASGELQRIKVTESDIGEGLIRDMTGSWVEGTMSNMFYQLANEGNVVDTDKSACQQSFSSSNITTLEAVNSTHLSENYLLNGQWFTPPLTQSGVTGVLRQVIVDGFAKTDNPVEMRVLGDKDLPTITRLFFCNAVRGIIPITMLSLLSGDKVCFSV
ncbi:aminotransferase class IV [Psychrobacter sp. CAL346-MNA-CIBAN-0220]|uniref:aminotransferase class IV n=1 Tax=Psychrobacter sp. CAL346-MNA-CIBAN-0220 TaxID=3140457 RepID=UPI00331E414B